MSTSTRTFEAPKLKQARYWTFTQPRFPKDGAFNGLREHFSDDGELPRPEIRGTAVFIAGQLEIGEKTDYQHYQCIVYYKNKRTRKQVRDDYPFACGLEPTGTSAIEKYIRKESTGVDGTYFEDGQRPTSTIRTRNDYDAFWHAAIAGPASFEQIDGDVRLRCINQLTKIRTLYKCKPTGAFYPKDVRVFWGEPGTGKSRRMRWEAMRAANQNPEDVYHKDGCNKWWNLYDGQKLITIDEFGGDGAVN
nr:rep protein [Cressdnaviricota sp.]